MRKLLNHFDKSVDACVVTDGCEVKQLGAYRNSIRASEGNTPHHSKCFTDLFSPVNILSVYYIRILFIEYLF